MTSIRDEASHPARDRPAQDHWMVDGEPPVVRFASLQRETCKYAISFHSNVSTDATDVSREKGRVRASLGGVSRPV